MASLIRTFVNSFSNRLEPPVRKHLKNVYACLSMSMIAAAIGAYTHMYTQLLQSNFFTTIGGVCLGILLSVTSDNGKNKMQRLSYLLGFAFLFGLGLGPILSLVGTINPSIIVTALVGTTVVFVSFSISALLAERGSWLYLGGTLISMLNIMIMCSLANFFLGSWLLHQANLYVGLFLMCGFVIYDTQLIIEKHHMGNKDFILHSLDLFIDFVGIFRHLLVLLTQQEISKNQRKRKE